uniref:Matrin-type domain-containing protein n=1 Tax=Lotharella oceanica TaxID=641309 RepID=A0A7S2TVJ7_9EUKA|mmetsp:Transcript_31858/g.59380  ORF Transcript_31858/g.59380 Transcript_31858/m.59380 type:complete len:188 (+) Transcript_31858:62-625(+)
MGRFYCDYCDIFLTHDNREGRRQHCQGRKHLENVYSYYNQLGLASQQELSRMMMEKMQDQPVDFDPYSYQTPSAAASSQGQTVQTGDASPAAQYYPESYMDSRSSLVQKPSKPNVQYQLGIPHISIFLIVMAYMMKSVGRRPLLYKRVPLFEGGALVREKRGLGSPSIKFVLSAFFLTITASIFCSL